MTWYKQPVHVQLHDVFNNENIRALQTMTTLNEDKPMYIRFKGGSFDIEFLKSFKDHISRMGFKQLCTHFDGISGDFLSEHGFISISRSDRRNKKGYTYSSTIFDKTISDSLFEMVEKNVKEDAEESGGFVKILASSPAGLEVSTLGMVDTPFTVDNYSEDVIGKYKFIKEEFGKDNPCGRMVILHGEPGTGKSYFVKALVSEIKKTTFIYIPAGVMGSVSAPSIIATIMDYEERTNNKICLIVEDADSSLKKRDNHGSTPGHLSELLNLSDGLLSELIDLRIIATTNIQKLDIDAAALRPGRLCARVDFDLLPPAKANALYRKISGKDVDKFTKPVPLANIYAAKNEDYLGMVDKKKENPELGQYA